MEDAARRDYSDGDKSLVSCLVGQDHVCLYVCVYVLMTLLILMSKVPAKSKHFCAKVRTSGRLNISAISNNHLSSVSARLQCSCSHSDLRLRDGLEHQKYAA